MGGASWGLAVTPVAPFKNLMVWAHKRFECGYSCVQKMLGYRELPCARTCVLTWDTHAHVCTQTLCAPAHTCLHAHTFTAHTCTHTC